MMKKFLSLLFILIVFTLISVCASAENLLEGSSFDIPEDSKFWSGGAIDESAVSEGTAGYMINNPFGEMKNGLITHVLEYNNSVPLEKGKIYRLSGKVLNPCSEFLSACRTRAAITPGSRTITINISGSDYEWSEFSTTFYVSDTDEYNLSFYFENGDEYIGFFVDSIVLEEQNLQIKSMELHGPDSVIIPAEGSMKTAFTPVLLTNEGTSVNLLLGTALTISSKFDTPGVEFYTDTASLIVYHDALPDKVITINCLLQLPEGNITVTKEVTLTNNLIENSDFESGSPDELWHSDSAITSSSDDENGTFMETSTNSYGQHGYYTTIYYSVPQVLVGGSLYVLHAQIKSDSPSETYTIYNGGATLTDDNIVNFNTPDISSNSWTDISAAFIPEYSGIYEIAITFWSRYDCTISADNIRLCCETLQPSKITMHAPGNIALPDTENIYPISAYVRDQLGNIIEDENCILSFDETPGAPVFSADDNTITVFPDTAEGCYTIAAYAENYPELTASIEISVSTDYIGDGGFENKAVNEWWLASSEGAIRFAISNDGSNKYAHIENDSGFFFMLNNSYMYLMENVAYSLSADISASSDVTVTAFIENMNGEAIPLAQFSSEDNDNYKVIELFLAESTDIGRLLLYIESESYPFTFDIDNIQLRKAIVSALNAEMNGDFSVNGTAKADFTFFSNITNSVDTSACVINWYISDSYSGEYTQLSESGAYIYFDTDFADKYVYFEVTPVCPETGFSGTTLRSLPRHISSNETYEDTSEEIPPPVIPSEPEVKPTFSPVSLPEKADNTFTDTQEHWAKDYIASLASLNVINGRGNNIFDPDAPVTRAEFSKMVCLSFGVLEKSGNIFSDIQPDSWYSPYVNTLYESGIINGVSENIFAPDKEITREEAIVILMRIYEKMIGELPQKTAFRFYDDVSISDWASDFVYAGTTLSVITGFEDNVFLPLESVSRSQSAAMICRMLTVISDAESLKTL